MSLKPPANASYGPQKKVQSTLVYLSSFFVLLVFFLVSPSYDNLSPQALCSLCLSAKHIQMPFKGEMTHT